MADLGRIDRDWSGCLQEAALRCNWQMLRQLRSWESLLRIYPWSAEDSKGRSRKRQGGNWKCVAGGLQDPLIVDLREGPLPNVWNLAGATVSHQPHCHT